MAAKNLQKSKKPRVRKTQPAEVDAVRACADDLYIHLASGKTMAEFCRQPGRPILPRIYEALAADADLAVRIERARVIGYDVIADDCLKIADTQLLGRRTKRSDAGVEIVEEDVLGHRKLQIETRIKLLAKWHPKKYGEKLDVEHKGAFTVTLSKADVGVL